MNNNFLLLDKNSNQQKNATAIVSFNFDSKDYLVYSIEENMENDQVFVSRIIKNSEGKYFIDNISIEEKGKLSNIVYNIVILLPTEEKKGESFDNLVVNFIDKLSVKLLSVIPVMDIQDYYPSCSIAITNKSLISTAIKFYDDNLRKSVILSNEVTPTWTAPVDVTSPAPVIKPQDSVILPELNLQSKTAEEIVPSLSATSDVSSVNNSSVDDTYERLAIVSDPSLSFSSEKVTESKIKEAGFADNKYIIIGTICLLLAVAVIITAYFLIKNL